MSSQPPTSGHGALRIKPLPADPRAEQRVRGPFEVTWSGSAGHRAVRVADFSLSGCFVEDIATPGTGERVTLTLRVPGGQPIEAAGRVVYLNPPLGFAVAFEQDECVVNELAAAVHRVSQHRPV
jgi:hypothetical protein